MVDDLQALFSHRTKLDVHKVQNHSRILHKTMLSGVRYFQQTRRAMAASGSYKYFFLILMFLCFTYTVSIFAEIQ